MNINDNIARFIDRDLVTVQKPGRYIGGEFNQVKKEWQAIPFHVALAFPDIYDIGFPNLGIAALYNIINSRNDALAERVFAPWTDMEMLLREKKIPLFTLESKIPLSHFDLVGFTLPYESLYTNTLNMLDLAGIPVRSVDREEKHPIILAGGHAAFNPQPMSAFIDAFVIGEGEIVIQEIIDALLPLKNAKRQEKLEILRQIPGVYVPDRQQDPNKAKPIKKRFVRKIDQPIINTLVPNVGVVHDRIAIEIMRGCSRGCRFCQAGMIMRPVRELKLENILETVKNAINKTGISEVSLLSLSTSDHTEISKILEGMDELSKQKQIEFSLPSLRIESFNQDLMDRMKSKRKGNFTIAPEAGSDVRRAAINKPIPETAIIDTVTQICKNRWNNLKLYFMIGFPGETDEDVYNIITLCEKIKSTGNKITQGRFKLHVSINTLIPKPHTPFQWAPLAKRVDIDRKYKILRDGLRRLKIKINYPDHDLIQLEALLSRGDVRIAELVYQAWKNGAKFDAWREGFSPDIWNNAIEQLNVNLDDYLYTERDLDQPLPWDFIDIGINKSYLQNEYLKSGSGELTPGCFQKCAGCGINNNLQIDCSKARIGAA